MSNQIVNGNMNLMGMDINIAQVLGDKIIDQYIANISEEDMQKIFDFISTDLWATKSKFSYELNEYVNTKIIKEAERDYWGHPKESPAIGELIKKKFNMRIRETLETKIEEIISTSDYQQRVEEIANELIDYAVNGYKEDMKARVRERLVGNVMDATPLYGNVSLQAVINQIIDQRIGC